MVTLGPGSPWGKLLYDNGIKQVFERPGLCLQAPAVLEGRDSDVLNISLLPQTSDLFTQIATLTQFFVINKSRPQS